jgi:hypothetical protein
MHFLVGLAFQRLIIKSHSPEVATFTMGERWRFWGNWGENVFPFVVPAAKLSLNRSVLSFKAELLNSKELLRGVYYSACSTLNAKDSVEEQRAASQ